MTPTITPGPWKAAYWDEFDIDTGDCIVKQSANGEQHLICAFTHSVYRNNQAANVRAVAALPSLLAALRFLEAAAVAAHVIVQNVRPDGLIAGDLYDAIITARAALAEATIEEPTQ